MPSSIRRCVLLLGMLAPLVPVPATGQGVDDATRGHILRCLAEGMAGQRAAMNACLDRVLDDCVETERADRCHLNLGIMSLLIFKESFTGEDPQQIGMIDAVDSLASAHCLMLSEKDKGDPNWDLVRHGVTAACLYDKRRRIIELMLPVEQPS